MVKLALIYAYPANAKHGSKILQIIKQTLEQKNIEYVLFDLYKDNFNPVLTQKEYEEYGGYTEYEIARIQQELKKADIYIFVYPIWWSAPPAILKGWIDRVFLPNFAFRYEHGKLIGLLKNKVALIICTYGGSAKHEQKVGFAARTFMQKAVLESCGIKTQFLEFFSIDTTPDQTFEHLLLQVPSAINRIIAYFNNLNKEQQPLKELIEKEIKKEQQEQEKQKFKLGKKHLEDLEYFQTEQKKAKQRARKS
jgi:NAD(P)H dehydrogenase (quinone)